MCLCIITYHYVPLQLLEHSSVLWRRISLICRIIRLLLFIWYVIFIPCLKSDGNLDGFKCFWLLVRFCRPFLSSIILTSGLYACFYISCCFNNVYPFS
jgi:hypothetical protein